VSRYEVTGKLNMTVDCLTDASVGDVIEADLDKDEERWLVDMGALRVLPDRKQSKSKDSKDSKPKEATKAEATPAEAADAEESANAEEQK
jgi:hypothetical protein